MVLSMLYGRLNALIERWILPEYRIPLLCVYSINAFLFISKVIFGNVIREFIHSYSNVRIRAYHNPIQIMFTNFMPLLLPFFVTTILQRMSTDRNQTRNN